MTQLAIKQWGNNLGVRLPAVIAKAAQLHADQRVDIVVDNDGRIVITPVADTKLSLAERLERYDPLRHGGEVMADAPVGAERW